MQMLLANQAQFEQISSDDPQVRLRGFFSIAAVGRDDWSMHFSTAGDVFSCGSVR